MNHFKKIVLLFPLLLLSSLITAQYDYIVSPKNPFGLPNPEAPQQIKDFEPMIGACQCQSVSRNPDGTWADTIDMIWTFKYIMNGMGVQDETLKADGKYSGSIRQFHSDSLKWYVHYYSSGTVNTSPLSMWEGNLDKEQNKIILYKEQTAPNGMKGFYRITFYDMNQQGYKWKGEWVDPSEKIVYPTWKIECIRE